MTASLRILSSLAIPVFALSAAACAADPTGLGADDPGASAQAIASPGAAAPTVLLSCTDKDDATRTARLSVDAAALFTWNIGGDQGDTKRGHLVSVSGPTQNLNGYTLHDTSGYYLELNTRDGIISEGGLDVECDPATMKLDLTLLDKLVADSSASIAQKQTYAVCPLAPPAEDSPGPDSITVRPALAGPGAILEGDDSDGDAWVLLATSSRTSAGKVSYAGDGALTVFAAGQHVKPFSAFSSQATTGGSTLGWDLHNAPLRPEGPCNVTGDAYAARLINSAH